MWQTDSSVSSKPGSDMPRRLVSVFCFAALACGAMLSARASQPTAGVAPAPRTSAARLQFRTEAIIDRQQGGLTVATISVPLNWTLRSRVQWNYADVSWPVRVAVRIESPDGSTWIEFFPAEQFYWLEPVAPALRPGAHNLGMVYAPHITIEQAMRRFVLAPYRASLPGFELVSGRPIDPQRLGSTFGERAMPGQAMGMHVRYQRDGRRADEDIYAFFGAGNRIPYTGPQGTSYESHRPLFYIHAFGALDGELDHVYPLLGYIVSTLRTQPEWIEHRGKVNQYLTKMFQAQIARGYAQIQAAANLSRQISANNESMLAQMNVQRRVQAQQDAARRSRSTQQRDSAEGFSGYLRGTEKVKDPYWGESEQSYNQRYHWTDGQGNYRSSNDAGYNPNVGAGGGPTWQQMEPAR